MSILSGARRLAVAVLLGAIVFGVSLVWLPVLVAAPLGLAVLGFGFSILTFRKLWPMNPAETKEHASRENYHPGLEEAFAMLVGLLSLGLVAMLFYSTSQGEMTTIGALCTLGSISGSWLMMHMIYAAQYAQLYYDDNGGIDFHMKEDPRYIDFIYFSTAIGMSFAVSDSDLESTRIRGVVVRHSLCSYLFGTLLMATMINILASLLAA